MTTVDNGTVKDEETMVSNAHGMTGTIDDKTEEAIQTETPETEITTIGHALSARTPTSLGEQYATDAKLPDQQVPEAKVDKDSNQGTDETIGINTTDVEAETSEEAVEPTTTTIGPARTATTPTSPSETSATDVTPHDPEAVVDEAKVAESNEEAVEPTTTTIGPARTATTPTSPSETSATDVTPHDPEAAVDEARVAGNETVHTTVVAAPTTVVAAPTTVVAAPTIVEDKDGINVHLGEATVVAVPTTVEDRDGINVQPAVATEEATMHLPTAEASNEVVDHLSVNHPTSDGHEESARDMPTTNPHEISAHLGNLRGKTTIEGR